VETFLVGASSEAEDSSSEDSSLDSSLELDAAAAVTFVGRAFTGCAFAGTGFDWVGVAAAPFAAALGGGTLGAAFAGAALAAGFGGSSESSLSESSSLSLSLADFLGALTGGSFEKSFLRSDLEAPVLAVVAGLSSDSLSLDSDEELALRGCALDCHGRMNFISGDQNAVKHTLLFVTDGLRAGWSSSEDDSDDSPLDSSFFPFLPVSCCAYPIYM